MPARAGPPSCATARPGCSRRRGSHVTRRKQVDVDRSSLPHGPRVRMAVHKVWQRREVAMQLAHASLLPRSPSRQGSRAPAPANGDFLLSSGSVPHLLPASPAGAIRAMREPARTGKCGEPALVRRSSHDARLHSDPYPCGQSRRSEGDLRSGRQATAARPRPVGVTLAETRARGRKPRLRYRLQDRVRVKPQPASARMPMSKSAPQARLTVRCPETSALTPAHLYP